MRNTTAKQTGILMSAGQCILFPAEDPSWKTKLVSEDGLVRMGQNKGSKVNLRHTIIRLMWHDATSFTNRKHLPSELK